MKMGEYLLPLVIFKKVGREGKPKVDRYAGVTFYLDQNGLIATCGHIIDALGEDELLFVKEPITGNFLEVTNIRRHKTKDFAIANIETQNNKSLEQYEGEILPGLDVRTWGYTSAGMFGDNIHVEGRLFKGHIVRTSGESQLPFANSTCELSFPSLSGFSGAPLLSEGNSKLVGMLFNNSESTIQVYSYVQIDDGEKILKESIHKIVELGLAHTIDDINLFIKEIKSS